MSRRTTLLMFIALFAMTVATLVGSTNTARAQQNPNCCTYTVNVQGIRPECFPFRIYYRWLCLPNVVVVFYPANGTYVAPTPTPPPCPPACILRAISLDGVNFFGPNQTWTYVVGNCCYVVNFGYDANGCIVINVTPC